MFISCPVVYGQRQDIGQSLMYPAERLRNQQEQMISVLEQMLHRQKEETRLRQLRQEEEQQRQSRVGLDQAYGLSEEVTEAPVPPRKPSSSENAVLLHSLNCNTQTFLRSRRFDAKTFVEFQSAGSQPVNLYWIADEGRLIPYGAIRPGQARAQQTFVTHPWVTTNLEGKCLGDLFPRYRISCCLSGREIDYR
jgi:hypothetical protein